MPPFKCQVLFSRVFNAITVQLCSLNQLMSLCDATASTFETTALQVSSKLWINGAI